MKIEDLFIYPVKSTEGICLSEVNVTSIGFENDRYFGIANSNNEIITARENAQLLKLKTEINNTILKITYKNQSKTVSLTDEMQDIELLLFKKEAAGQILNQEINDWLTAVLKTESKLVRINFKKLRETDSTAISFNDCYPIHLISKESVASLNEKLEIPVELNRFRPNIIVSGFKAFEEEQWTAIQIGTCEFRIAAQTKRCSLITINPITGEKSKSQEPLRTIAKEMSIGNKANFGIYLVPTKLGTIRNSDTLIIKK
ncbi:MOSC N-terminal beta barrel domain-containing protein [Aurantibacter sp.]|uniref:MOSC domain-containing protein n=1 Tax=Aurantibacter sp. TaxID=2807103 RepID=UPI00326474E3